MYKLSNKTIEDNGGYFQVYKDYLGLIKTFLDKHLMENPVWIGENFIKKFFNDDREFSEFYSFLSKMVSIPENKLDNGYILFKLE